jgi:hypothetical protein
MGNGETLYFSIEMIPIVLAQVGYAIPKLPMRLAVAHNLASV